MLSGLFRYLELLLFGFSFCSNQSNRVINEGMGSRQNQLHSLVTVGPGCHSLHCMCVHASLFDTYHSWSWMESTGIWPMLWPYLTPSWPLCLAWAAEQRVSLAWAADWWLSALPLGWKPQPVPFHKRTEQVELTKGAQHDHHVNLEHIDHWNTACIKLVHQLILNHSVIADEEGKTICCFCLLEKEKKVDASCFHSNYSSYFSITASNNPNWTWTRTLIGCWPCLYEQKGQLA